MSWHTRPWSIQAVFHSGFKPWNDGFLKIELPPIHPNISWRSENTLPILGEINTVACPILSRFPMINLFQYPGQVSRMKATASLRSSSLLEANCARVCSAWSKLNKLRVRRNLIAADDRMRTEDGQNISKKKINDAESDLIYPYNFIDFMIIHRTPTIKSRQNLYSLRCPNTNNHNIYVFQKWRWMTKGMNLGLCRHMLTYTLTVLGLQVRRLLFSNEW